MFFRLYTYGKIVVIVVVIVIVVVVMVGAWVGAWVGVGIGHWVNRGGVDGLVAHNLYTTRNPADPLLSEQGEDGEEDVKEILFLLSGTIREHEEEVLN